MAAASAVLLLLAALSQPLRSADMPAEIGRTPIRFYSGNLSVNAFMAYWGTAPSGVQAEAIAGATAEQNAMLKRCSVSSMCDYLAWSVIEKEQGVWDWSLYEANQKTLANDGIGYNIFAWLHFPPKWFEDDPRFVRYTNLANGSTIPQLSLWAPYTLQLYDEFYGRLARQFGDRIGFIRLAMPSEYGEIGYCAGMTNWLRPQPNAAAAYWCGDPAALQHFREKMLAKYRTLDALNRGWGTRFDNSRDISPPDVRATMDSRRNPGPERVRWLDFADWYNQSWTDFMRSAVKIVRKHFPRKEIIISLGYGAEDLRYGNDQSRHIAAMKKLGVAAQTPGDVGYFATRRVSSACRAYGVPYFTEPPGDVPRDRQITRIWMDGSNGTQTWFDYPQNLDRARDLFVNYKQYLTGASPVSHIALWLPTLEHWLHPEQGWPAAVAKLADELRDLADYEVVDDRLVTDGALQSLDTRLLVLVEPRLLQRGALNKAIEWVRRGGTVLVLAREPIETPDGRRELWNRIVKQRTSLDALLSGGSPAASIIGKGRVILVDWEEKDGRREADAVAAVYRQIGVDSAEGLALADGTRDGVWMTEFKDRILMLNTTQEARGVVVHTQGREMKAEIGPSSITHVRIAGGRRT